MWKVQATEKGVNFNIRVQPKASKNQIVGLQGEELKVKITAPPVEGEANEACLSFLAEVLEIPKSACAIIAGFKGRSKVIQVKGLSQVEVERRLLKNIKQS